MSYNRFRLTGLSRAVALLPFPRNGAMAGQPKTALVRSCGHIRCEQLTTIFMGLGAQPEESSGPAKLVLWIHLASCPGNGVIFHEYKHEQNREYRNK